KNPAARPSDGEVAAWDLGHLGDLPDTPPKVALEEIPPIARQPEVPMCLVLIGPPGAGDRGPEDPRGPERFELAKRVAPPGARIQLLFDGSCAVMIKNPDLLEQAILGARCALAFQAALPDDVVAVSMSGPGAPRPK